MPTITEDYVSFETAKLLKEKGFNIQTLSFYREIGKGFDFPDDTYLFDWNGSKGYLSAPTLHVAMKWLREVHNIHIVLSPNKKMNNQYSSIIFVDKEGELHPQPTDFFHGSYEEAAETAIKYCLEKII